MAPLELHGRRPMAYRGAASKQSLVQKCHAEPAVRLRRGEVSGAGLPWLRVDPPPQTLRCAQGDMVLPTFEARPSAWERARDQGQELYGVNFCPLVHRLPDASKGYYWLGLASAIAKGRCNNLPFVGLMIHWERAQPAQSAPYPEQKWGGS